MTRLDPKQLLGTLSALLDSDGGIKSSLEVPRIVQLMQKFSKKLTAKCIYIHILRSSSTDLLEQFLSEKGWDLLNAWFYHALKSGNYYLCRDLVKLFALCPMTADRIKDQNQVLQQWTCLVADLSLTLNLCSSPPRVQSPADLQHYVDDDYSEDYIPPSSKRKPRPSRPQEKKKKAGKVPLPSTNWQPTVLAKEASMSGTLSESETQIETESDSSLKSKPKPRPQEKKAQSKRQAPVLAKPAEKKKLIYFAVRDIPSILTRGSLTAHSTTVNCTTTHPSEDQEKCVPGSKPEMPTEQKADFVDVSTPVLNKTVSVTGTSARAQKLAVTKLRVKIHEITIEMEEVVKQENYLKAHELKQKISSLEAEIKNIQASEAFVSFSPAATGIMKGVFQIFSSDAGTPTAVTKSKLETAAAGGSLSSNPATLASLKVPSPGSTIGGSPALPRIIVPKQQSLQEESSLSRLVNTLKSSCGSPLNNEYFEAPSTPIWDDDEEMNLPLADRLIHRYKKNKALADQKACTTATKNLTEPMLKSIAKENVDKMMLTSFGPEWEELLDGPAIQKSLEATKAADKAFNDKMRAENLKYEERERQNNERRAEREKEKEENDRFEAENRGNADKLIADLTKPLLHKMFEDNIDYITRVWDGSLRTSRHDSWNIGGGPRQRLMWRQSCHPFSDDQLNWTLECINTKFVGPDVKKRISMNNYIWKVVLPETLTKFYMNFFNISLEDAEIRMKMTPL